MLNGSFSTLIDRAERLRGRRQPAKAIALLTIGLNQGADGESDARLRLTRAECYADLSDWSRAEKDCRRAMTADARRAATLLARCLLALDRAEEAATLLSSLKSAEPKDAGFWVLYGKVLSASKKHDDAVAAMQQACAVDEACWPELSDAMIAGAKHHDNIALTENLLGLASDRALPVTERRPAAGLDTARLWANRGVSLSALGRSKECVEAYREALRLEPTLPGAKWALGMSLLRLGQLEEGFRCNEHRQKAAGDCRRLGVRPWQGESLEGKHLVVTIEQGFGDTVQFVRFLPHARRVATRTTLIVTPAIERVLRSNPALGELRSDHPGFGFGDYQTLVMSLPLHLGIAGHLESQLGPCPYLFPEPGLVAKWRERLPRRPKIGLVWQGNPSYAGDRWRSMSFRYYEPLVRRFKASCCFLSLQKHFGRDQLQASVMARDVLELADQIDNEGDSFVDSLAVLSLLDLLITTDTGLAHLAGAAGVPTWLLLGAVADWRWGIDRTCPIWYPTVRLFRQKETDDWSGVVAEIMRELERLGFGALAPSRASSGGSPAPAHGA